MQWMLKIEYETVLKTYVSIEQCIPPWENLIFEKNTVNCIRLRKLADEL